MIEVEAKFEEGNMDTLTAPMTAEEFLALPDDGKERWLIAGQLREFPMTVRNRFHSRAMTRVARFLDSWLDAQPSPRGEILTGDAGVRLDSDPDTIFGVDVAYVSAETIARQNAESSLACGSPILAVEILSPSDTIENVNEKIDAYLQGGVLVTWIVDPHRRTVTVYRLNEEPVLVNARQELIGEPELPGFRVPVARLFD